MFTGLVQALGTLLASTPTPAGRRLTVARAELASAPIAPGDSVCVSGVCLTAVAITPQHLSFDAITETLHRSTLGLKKPGDRLNLELSLQPNSFVGGHFVQGHVDAVGRIVAVKNAAEDWRITTRIPAELMPTIVPKGSVTIEGVSMTIAEVKGDTFTIAVIPTTLARTSLGSLAAGDAVNIETDILARTVVHYLKGLGDRGQGSGKPGVTMATLMEQGFV